MTFRNVFIALIIAFALIVSALVIQRARPRIHVLAGTPPFAPLLLPNLSILGLIGLLALDQRIATEHTHDQPSSPRPSASR